LKQCIPGCQVLDMSSPTEMTATVVFKVGPVKATFGGKVTLSDLDPPNSYRISGEGSGGVAGFAKGGAAVRLEAEGPDVTVLHYEVDAQIGGKLAQLGDRSIADAKALDAIRTAFEIELGGMAFYKRAAAESTDPLLRDLFGKFAEMEKEHMATLSARYHADVAEASAGFKTERAAVYAGIPNDPKDPANLFRIAIAFEQRAVKFFSEKGAQAPAGSVEGQLYKELAAEEREHVDLLVTEFNRFKAGKPGLL